MSVRPAEKVSRRSFGDSLTLWCRLLVCKSFSETAPQELQPGEQVGRTVTNQEELKACATVLKKPSSLPLSRSSSCFRADLSRLGMPEPFHIHSQVRAACLLPSVFPTSNSSLSTYPSKLPAPTTGTSSRKSASNRTGSGEDHLHQLRGCLSWVLRCLCQTYPARRGCQMAERIACD